MENPRHPFPPRDESRPKGLNVLGTFANHPELARAYHTFNGHILFNTTLSIRQRELVVLRVAFRRQCEYEWAQHVVLARDNDFTEDEIAAVPDGPDSRVWTAHEAALRRAAEELIVVADLPRTPSGKVQKFRLRQQLREGTLP